MESTFYYPVILHRSDAFGGVIAPVIDALPVVQMVSEQVVILSKSTGDLAQGLYVWDGSRWRYAMTMQEISRAVIEGDSIDVYFALVSDVVGIPSAAHVYRNSLLFHSTTLPAGADVIWAVRKPLDTSIGDVASVNGQTPDVTGNVTVNIDDITGLTTALANAGKVKKVNNVDPDVSGNVTVSFPVTSVSGQVGDTVVSSVDNNPATGVSLVSDSGATTGTAKFKRLVQGSNVTLTVDGNGNVVVSSTAAGTLTAVNPEGTGTALVDDTGSISGIATIRSLTAGTGVTITPSTDGKTLTLATTNVGSLTKVSSEGTGTSLVDNDGTTGGIAVLKSIAAGSNITITPAADGKTLTFAANQAITPATTAVIGGVIVKAGLSVDGLGNLSLAAPTGVNLGGVKAGTNVTIASDGTISTPNAPVTSVNGQTGATTIQATETNAATGVTLITNGGALSGVIRLKTLVAGTNVTLGADVNGNITISAAAGGGVSSVSTQTGAVVVQATNNNGASGVSLIADSGSTTANIKLKTLVAGTGITLTADANGNLQVAGTSAYVLPTATDTVLGGVKIGANVVITNGVISVASPFVLPIASTTVLGGVKQGTGVTIDANGVISSTATGGVASITAGTSGALTGAITFTAGNAISLSNTGNSIQVSGTGVPEAPNDNGKYARQNLTWIDIGNVGSAITSITGQTGTGAISLVEADAPANSAILKSLVAGANVTVTEVSGLITVAASIPGGTVATVNGQAPDGSGAVTLTAANVNAIPIAGNVTVAGPLNMGNHELSGIAVPVNPTDAIPLSFITGLVIDGGVIG